MQPEPIFAKSIERVAVSAALDHDKMLKLSTAISLKRMADRQAAPHVAMRPRIYPDGNMWCALYGEDLQMGVCGFGATPALACADFDKSWHAALAQPGAEGG